MSLQGGVLWIRSWVGRIGLEQKILAGSSRVQTVIKTVVNHSCSSSSAMHGYAFIHV